MSAPSHLSEGTLLELAYGELPQNEADALQGHLEGCAQCSQALADIRGVRAAMAPLKSAAVPDAGLESLLAYAQQATRKDAAGPAPVKRWRARWTGMIALGASMAVVMVIGVQVSRQTQVSMAPATDPVQFRAPPDVPTAAEGAVKEVDPSPRQPQKERFASRPAKKAMAPPPAPAKAEAERSRDEELAQDLEGSSASSADSKADSQRESGLSGAGMGTGVGSLGGSLGGAAQPKPAPARAPAAAPSEIAEASAPSAPVAAKEKKAAPERGAVDRGVPSSAMSKQSQRPSAAPSSSVAGLAFEPANSPAELLAQARAAAAGRSWAVEAQAGAAVVAQAVTGALREEALHHACQGYSELGDVRARSFCGPLMREFPHGAAARAARAAADGQKPPAAPANEAK